MEKVNYKKLLLFITVVLFFVIMPSSCEIAEFTITPKTKSEKGERTIFDEFSQVSDQFSQYL